MTGGKVYRVAGAALQPWIVERRENWFPHSQERKGTGNLISAAGADAISSYPRDSRLRSTSPEKKVPTRSSDPGSGVASTSNAPGVRPDGENQVAAPSVEMASSEGSPVELKFHSIELSMG